VAFRRTGLEYAGWYTMGRPLSPGRSRAQLSSSSPLVKCMCVPEVETDRRKQNAPRASFSTRHRVGLSAIRVDPRNPLRPSRAPQCRRAAAAAALETSADIAAAGGVRRGSVRCGVSARTETVVA
jgi:hypothetical protein